LPPLIEAIKEQQEQIEELKAEIEKLKDRKIIEVGVINNN